MRYIVDYIKQEEPTRKVVEGCDVTLGKGISIIVLADTYEAAMELAFVMRPRATHSTRSVTVGHELRLPTAVSGQDKQLPH